MKRTDHKRIEYPEGLSTSDKRFCRNLIKEVRDHIDESNHVVIACSGGIDSTVLAHAVGQGLRINPFTYFDLVGSLKGNKLKVQAIYINHHIRSNKETKKEENFIKNTIGKWVHAVEILDGRVKKGSGLQERARDMRYKALENHCNSSELEDVIVDVLTAHNANDNAETKLFGFVTGRNSEGISKRTCRDWCRLHRPLLDFTRADIERYAKCFNLTWREDASNATDDYTRNKIRHHLIPWIEKNINKSVVKTLSKN